MKKATEKWREWDGCSWILKKFCSAVCYRTARWWETVCLCVCVCVRHRNRQITRWMALLHSVVVVHYFQSDRLSGHLVSEHWIWGGNDTMSMAEWVSSEVMSAEVGLVLLQAVIHRSAISLSFFFFCHWNQPVWKHLNPFSLKRNIFSRLYLSRLLRLTSLTPCTRQDWCRSHGQIIS